MKIERKKLIETLAKVQPGLASKEIIEQSKSFVFKGGKVQTYNDEISVSAKTDLDIEGAVKAEELYKLLNKSQAKEVDLEATDSELQLKTKASRAGIVLESEINLPLDQISKPGKPQPLPEDFKEAVKFCLFSVSSDMTKPVLTCLYVTGLIVTSCDNFRLTAKDMKTTIKDKFLLPSAAAKELLKYEPTHYSVSDAWIHFKCEGGVVFSCRTYEKEYPDVSGLLDVKGKKIKFPKRTKGMLDRASVFATTEFSQDSQVEVTVKDGTMMIHGKGEGGWFKEKSKVEYKGKEVKFTVNPDFLSQMLDILDEATVGENSLKLEGEGFVHVVSLM
jgi:DNA polymerase III sliding clamp (beta) subunit (PCNA family)